ncbi:MAG: cation-translocating P-type ATPase [Deltaproteobacteria bacterium]|nr:cation-translocating P-type ATPase [Deltaproteobacteria bacterium]
MSTPEPKLWHSQTTDQIARYWETDLERGHTAANAGALLQRLGPNALAEKPPPSLFVRLLGQISDVTVLALIAAALVAAILGFLHGEGGATFLERFGDSLAILAIVILNAILGLVQEKRAERALSALRTMTSPQARVVRNGQVCVLPAAEVVPGDLLELKEGDTVPADARVLWQANLEVTESALTGESFPVAKDADADLSEDTPLAERNNMVFMGTAVSRGRGRAVVVNTGMHTELGRIAGMLASMDATDTPLQAYLNRFGRQIVFASVLVSAIVFIAGLLQGRQTLSELFLLAVSLAVAAIPEGLPAITTIVLALGTQRMARRNALVRRLPAVEGLGSAQVICTDKTGTLTQNQMTVRQIHVCGETYAVGGRAASVEGAFTRAEETVTPRETPGLWRLLEHAAWAPDVIMVEKEERLELSGNPTDCALRVAARKGGVPAVEPKRVITELPFSSARKMATLVIQGEAGPEALVRGAPEILLDRATEVLGPDGLVPLTADERDRLRLVAQSWGEQAMRVVALAVRTKQPEDPHDWEKDVALLGMVGIVDPPRPEVAQAILEAQQAGIQTMMITGDHPSTARAIGREINLYQEGDLVLTGGELDMMDQQELENRVDRLRIVARATPLHKLRIVEALKARGLVCAMTGDGVNDAPAVKAASIGVAMGRAGTEVTKEAADLVLADDNYATIVHAVEEGRAIFTNIKKFIYFLLSSNTGIVLVVFFAGLLGWAAPLAPIQILWINLVTNGLPALALGVEPPEPRLMAAQPRNPGAPILGPREYGAMLGIGLVMAVAAMLAFALLVGDPTDHHSPKLRLAQAGAFAVLSLSPMFHAFNCRSATVSNFTLGWFGNRALWGAAIVGVGLVGLAIYVPALHELFRTEALGARDLALVCGLSAAPLVIGEAVKLLQRAPSRS